MHLLCCTQVKFNTPSSKRFSQQATSNNGGGTSANMGSAARMDSTFSFPTGSEDQLAAGEDYDMEEEEDIVHTGFLKEWTLMLHGTREPPYSQLSVRDPHSKLAIVKKAHTIAGPETSVPPQQQSAY